MITAIFFYNTIINALFVLNAAVFYALFRWQGRKFYLWIGVMFSLFLLDNLLPFMEEFLPGFLTFQRAHLLVFATVGNLLGLAITFAYRKILQLDQGHAMELREEFLWGGALVAYLSLSWWGYLLPGGQLLITLLRASLPIIVFGMSIYAGGHPDVSLPLAGGPQLTRPFVLALLGLQCADGLERLADLAGLASFIQGRYLSVEVFGVVVSLAALFYGWHHLTALFGMATKQSHRRTLGEQGQSRLDHFSHTFDLTPREVEVLQLVAVGFSNQAIADKLFISLGTAKTHVHNIYQKIGVKSRVQLMNLLLANPLDIKGR